MYGFAVGTRRGGHAHRECQQFLIAQEGRFEITLHDGSAEKTFMLSRPDQGLNIPAGIWVSLVSLDERSVITALASAPYDETDYLRDFGAFLAWRQSGGMPLALTDGRILVRPYRAGDAAAFSRSAIESAAEVGRWLAWCRPDFDVDRAAAYIRRSLPAGAHADAYSLGVFDATDGGAHAGGIAINRIDWDARCGNLGYWIATRVAGRGFGRAAAKLMCAFAFETLGLRRIEIQVELGNTGSRRIAEGLGARHEGTLRSRVHRDGSWHDVEVFGLLRDEFPPPTEPK